MEEILTDEELEEQMVDEFIAAWNFGRHQMADGETA